MFGNLIKLLLLAVIIGAVALFVQQRGWEPIPTAAEQAETPETATAPTPMAESLPTEDAAVEPAPAAIDEAPSPAQVEEAPAPAQAPDIGEAWSTPQAATPIVLPPEHPGPVDTSPPSDEWPANAPTPMQ